MKEWADDPWIDFAGEMAEDFFRMHRETMPEDPHQVWNENEITYFCFAFTLWAAKSRFGLTMQKTFDSRAPSYRTNIQRLLEDSELIDEEGSETASFNAYLVRESEYLQLFTKGSGNVFRAMAGSIFKPACKAFVERSCKTYIFSERDLIKIVCAWLIEKGMNFERQLQF